jgi:hypothetical protein
VVQLVGDNDGYLCSIGLRSSYIDRVTNHLSSRSDCEDAVVAGIVAGGSRFAWARRSVAVLKKRSQRESSERRVRNSQIASSSSGVTGRARIVRPSRS